MCGIWTLIKNEPKINDKIIKSIYNVKNRGPDSTSIHEDKNYITAFHRLAINDLSVDGNQPFYMSTITHNYILLANAEIYNHKDLEYKYNIKTNSTSDCAFLLPFYIELEKESMSTIGDTPSSKIGVRALTASTAHDGVPLHTNKGRSPSRLQSGSTGCPRQIKLIFNLNFVFNF